jgi:ClpP class serine protease
MAKKHNYEEEHEPEEEGSDLRTLVMAQRQAIVTKLEKKRQSKVITLIHRREPWSQEEDKDGESITIEDSEFVLTEIGRTAKDKSIDLIVHSPGGLALAAEMIAIALKNHPGKTTVMVPFYAMSGGTLIALAADEILMENYSVLGPVDPQFQGYPAAAYMSLLQEKPLQAVQDEVVLMAHVARLAVGQVKNFVKWLLADRLSQEKCEALADFLTGGYITHDTPLTLATARGWGLNVHEGVPHEVFELFTTCEFGLCKRPCLASYG